VALAAAAVGAALASRSAEADTGTPTVADLQAQIAALTARIAALETWKASAGVFTQTGSNWTFAPPSGDVTINASGQVRVSGKGTTTIEARGGTSANLYLRSEGSYQLDTVMRKFPA
jgi:uncharacterized cupin superfamily protein